jgi:selenocysteine lyase/cysteine desulfurase
VDDEAFWAQVRSRFLIPPDRIYLNNGTLGPSPSVVVEAVHEHTRRVAATYPPGVSWDDLKGSISSLIGGDSEGFVFPRNTTEAMSFVANGLEVDPEAEVLTTDHEHIGGLEPWRLLSARRGPRLAHTREERVTRHLHYRHGSPGSGARGAFGGARHRPGGGWGASTGDDTPGSWRAGG